MDISILIFSTVFFQSKKKETIKQKEISLFNPFLSCNNKSEY